MKPYASRPNLRPCDLPNCPICRHAVGEPQPREDSDRLDRGFLVAVAVGWLLVGVVYVGGLLGWWA